MPWKPELRFASNYRNRFPSGRVPGSMPASRTALRAVPDRWQTAGRVWPPRRSNRATRRGDLPTPGSHFCHRIYVVHDRVMPLRSRDVLIQIYATPLPDVDARKSTSSRGCLVAFRGLMKRSTQIVLRRIDAVDAEAITKPARIRRRKPRPCTKCHANGRTERDSKTVRKLRRVIQIHRIN